MDHLASQEDSASFTGQHQGSDTPYFSFTTRGTATAHVSLQGPANEAKSPQLPIAIQQNSQPDWLETALNMFITLLLCFGIAAYYLHLDQASCKFNLAAAHTWACVSQLQLSMASKASRLRAAAVAQYSSWLHCGPQVRTSAQSAMCRSQQVCRTATKTVCHALVCVVTLGQLTPSAVRWRSVVIDSFHHRCALTACSAKLHWHKAAACLKSAWCTAASQAAHFAHVVKSKTSSVCASITSSTANVLKVVRQVPTQTAQLGQSACNIGATIPLSLCSAAARSTVAVKAGFAKLAHNAAVMASNIKVYVTASSKCAGSTASNVCKDTAAISHQALLSMHARMEMLCPGLGTIAPVMITMVGLMWLDPEAVMSVCCVFTMVILLDPRALTWPAGSTAQSVRPTVITTDYSSTF